VFLGGGGGEGTGGGGLGLSVKLPASGMVALAFPFAQPTGYGLGKSGWVTARFGPKDSIPMPMLRQWIVESYRAIAPKTLVARLDGGAPPLRKPARRRAASKPAKTRAKPARGRRRA